MVQAARVMQGRRLLRVILFLIGFLAALLTGVHIGSRQIIFNQIERMDPADGERLQQLLAIQGWLGAVVLLCLMLIGFCVIRPLADDLDARTAELDHLRAERRARDGPDDGTLPGRASLDELLMHDLARARRHGQALGLLRIDVRGMEGLEPDRVERLRQGLVRTLRGTVRSSDYLADAGKEEIALVVPILRSVEGLGILCDRVIAALGIYLRSKGEDGTSIHVGVAVGWPSNGVPAEVLMTQAEEALVRARQDDGNSWRYHASAIQGLTKRLQLAKG